MMIFEGMITTKNLMCRFGLDLWQCLLGIEYMQAATSGVINIFIGPLFFRIERSQGVQFERMREAIKNHDEGRCQCTKEDRSFIDKVIKEMKGDK